MRNTLALKATLISALSLALLPAKLLAQEAAPLKVASQPELCEISQQAIVHASKIRGLSLKETVPCVVQDKPEVEAFLQETIKVDLPPKKLQMEEVAYRSIGLIPDSFNYATTLVEFLVSQIGGYYDPKRKQFIMAAWLPAAVQFGVAVHELTHALQDQHYGLLKIIDRKSGTTDTDIAISALVEGDASAVMFDYERSKAGQPALRYESSVDALILMQVLGATMGSGDGEIPDSLKALLIFPYSSGLRFVHALLRTGGYTEVSKAYQRLPNSTREVLHPQEYRAGTFTPSIPELSQLESATHTYLPEYSDVLGEFGISSLLSGEAPSRAVASEAAMGWIGDRVGVFPVQAGKRLVSWLTRWESKTDAEQFLQAYQKFIQARYKKELPTSWTVLTPSKSGRMISLASEVSVQFLVQE
jgi:hypothetical protein